MLHKLHPDHLTEPPPQCLGQMRKLRFRNARPRSNVCLPNNLSLGCVVPPGSSRAFEEQMPGRERSRDLPRVGQCEWLAGLARSPIPFLVGDPEWVTLGGAAVQIHTASPWAVWTQKQDDFSPPATSKRVHRHECSCLKLRPSISHFKNAQN